MAESLKAYNDIVEITKGEKRSRNSVDGLDSEHRDVITEPTLEVSHTEDHVSISVGGRGVNGSSYRRQSSALRSLYTKAKQEAVLQTTRERGELPDHEDENRNRWHARSSKVSKKLYEPLLEQGFVHLEKVIKENYETIKDYENTIDRLLRENKRLKISETGSCEVFSILIDEEKNDIENKSKKERKASKYVLTDGVEHNVTLVKNNFDTEPTSSVKVYRKEPPVHHIPSERPITSDILCAGVEESGINNSSSIYKNVCNIADIPHKGYLNIENALTMEELGSCSNQGFEGNVLSSSMQANIQDDLINTNYKIFDEFDDFDIDSIVQG